MADDILSTLTNMETINRYRFDKEGISFLEDILREYIQPKTAKMSSLSVKKKILITLRFLASGGFQINDSDIHSVSQSTVSKVIESVVNSLNNDAIVSRFIKFPTSRYDCDKQVQQFYGIAGFPKVIGVIDGTHIRIRAPSVHEEMYVNRKGLHSINAQIIFNGYDEIVDVVARWPGSTHDSRILQHSAVRDIFEGGILRHGNYHLLGDSGYACRRWLLTPYGNPRPGSQTNYNRALKVTRAKVERGIGQLKRRFGVLHGEIRMQPEKVCRIITACSVLHNICKARNVNLPMTEDELVENDIVEMNEQEEIGLRYRDQFANTYF